MTAQPQSNGRGGADDPGLLDAEQIGALLGVPKSWVLAQARAKRIPHSRLGKYVRFDRDAVLRWAKEDHYHGPRGAR